MKFKPNVWFYIFGFMTMLPRGFSAPLQSGRDRYLKPITHQDFLEAEKKDPYFKGRWKYFNIVVDLVRKLQPDSVLELGAYRLPLVQGSDTMDIVKVLDDLTYLHDATRIPWPVADDKYDLFIACEVWEHLGQKQKEAFKEVRRISRRAIFSFPFMWKYPEEAKDEEALSHRNIDESKIAEWTLHLKPKSIAYTRDKRFVIYYFEFDRGAK
jgi:hypothetical protein